MSANEKETGLGLTAAKNLFIDWTVNTTCHGINDIRKAATWWSRILWILVVSCMTIIMCIQVFDVCNSFNKHQWMTTVYEETSIETTANPTVTVCSHNRLRKSETERLNLTEDNMMYLFDKVPTQAGSIFNRTDIYIDNGRAREDFIEWRKRNNMTTKEIFQRLGPLCGDLIDFISGEDFINIDCSSTQHINVSTVFTMEFGQCYQITFSLPNQIVSAGKKQSITLLLNAQLKDYLSFATNNYMDEGFALQIHYGPRVVMGHWLTVAPGFHYMMGISEHQNRISFPRYIGDALQIMRLPFTSEPPCLLEPVLRYNDNRDYSREQCILECSNDQFVEHCGCLLFVDSPLVRMCEAEEVDLCHDYLESNNFSLVNDTCISLCKEPCTDRRIQATSSFSRFPTKAQLQNFQQLLLSIEPGTQSANLTLQQMRDEYALVDIYFEKMQIMVVEKQELLGLEKLISTCGGLMSLYISVSILTIVQTMAYLIYGFANIIAWPWKKTARHIAPPIFAAMSLTLSTLKVHQEHDLPRMKVEELMDSSKTQELKSSGNHELHQRYRTLSNAD